MLPKSVQKLIEELSKLPSIGPKSAERLAFYLLNAPEEKSQALAEALLKLKHNLKSCEICHALTDESPCKICKNPARDQQTICVIEDYLDMVALEKTGCYKGVYYILGGVLSPADGVGPDDLKINGLEKRLKQIAVKEIILATNPTVEGETTAIYLAKRLRQLADQEKLTFNISRIARGLPVGGDLEYADEITITRAMEGRKEY
jgi:recombination protein RecR